MLSQDDAHRMAHSCWARKRYQSIDLFNIWSRDFPDKEQIWQDMIFLTKDKRSYIRRGARNTLSNAFNKILDKEKGWHDLHKLTIDENSEVRCTAAHTIGRLFDQIPDKKTGWEDLHQLIKDDNFNVQIYAISAVSSAFEHIPNKEQAWEDMHRFTHNKDDRLRTIATLSLSSALSDTSFKERAWEDLHRMANDKAPTVRAMVAQELAFSFSEIPDRDLAWQDFHQLINDENKNVKIHALILIERIFRQIDNKEIVWKDLHILANDKDINTRSSAIRSLISIFSDLADKKSAWQDIHQAIYENKIKTDDKYYVANKLGEVIEQIPDKNQLIQDLSKLAKGKKNQSVKGAVAHSISKLGRFYIEKKDFKMGYECFDLASSASSGGFLKPSDFRFYSYKAFSFYYRGRFLVSKLPDTKEPQEYIENIKNAVDYFGKAIKYIQDFDHEEEACCFPICLNIYSALYEYNLSLSELDEKRIKKIENYLDEASNQCTLAGKENGIKTVKILKKLSEALRDCIDKVKLESKRQDASKKGKGIGYDARYITFIEKSRKDVESHFAEIDDLLNQLEAPIFTRIAGIEKENLKNMGPRENENELLPKSLGQLFYEFIKQIWIFVMAAIGILASMITVMLFFR